VRLEGGGEVRSVDSARGPVAVSVYPWEITLEASAGGPADSALNRVEAEVASVVTIGNRARIGLSLPQPLGAEVTARSAAAMGLRPGSRVIAAWKASATRLVPLG
jgi:molybdate transport system ATP-binding protein